MPRYQELLALIRSGKTPQEIMKHLSLPPSKLRRMLKGKRLNACLKIERELTGLIVSHCTVTRVHDVIKRFVELMEAANPETARKVCLALISEGLQSSKIPTSEDDAPSEQQQPPKLEPWMLLKPATAPLANIGKPLKENVKIEPSNSASN